MKKRITLLTLFLLAVMTMSAIPARPNLWRMITLAEVFLNLRHGCLEGFQFSLVGGQFALFYLFCHILFMFKV